MNKYVDAGAHGIFSFPKQDKLISTVLHFNKVWEQSEWDFIKDNLKSGQNCINLGAHVGFFTCLMSQIVGGDGKVWSFEPNPELVECLKDNVFRLGKGNVEIFPYAASNKNEDSEMFINLHNTADNRLFDFSLTDDQKFFDKKIAVKSVKVDDIIVDKKIDFVLSDCQGWDFFALEGMDKIIKRDMPTILLEIAPYWLEKLNVDYGTIIKQYEEMGYSVSCIGHPNILSAQEAIDHLANRQGDYNIDLILEKK